jgi:hypothetical protein
MLSWEVLARSVPSKVDCGVHGEKIVINVASAPIGIGSMVLMLRIGQNATHAPGADEGVALEVAPLLPSPAVSRVPTLLRKLRALTFSPRLPTPACNGSSSFNERCRAYYRCPIKRPARGFAARARRVLLAQHHRYITPA